MRSFNDSARLRTHAGDGYFKIALVHVGVLYLHNGR